MCVYLCLCHTNTHIRTNGTNDSNMKRHPFEITSGESYESNTKKVKDNDSIASSLGRVDRHHHRHHSQALQTILDNNYACCTGNDRKDSNCSDQAYDNMNNQRKRSNIDDFFQNIWQRCPKFYKKAHTINREGEENGNGNSNSMTINDGSNSACLLQSVLSMGWDGVSNMLEKSRTTFSSDGDRSNLQPLFLRNQTPLQHVELQTQYSFNPFAAYLDGCSIIQNHADYFSLPLSNLCLDMQRSFPHVYCNTYLTPPNSSTVKAHADDRDVFVIQIKGRKKWKVYKKVPVPYPYSHEQVGKNGIPIPQSVISNLSSPSSTSSTSSQSSPILLEIILEEGDVLYMPRGYVHEASTTNCNDQPSFHATMAIMTSDWSLSKTVSEMTRKCLDDIPEYRMAVDVNIGIQNKDLKKSIDESSIKEKFNSDLDIIFHRMRECITYEAIAKKLGTKYGIHNRQAEYMKKQLLHDGTKDDVVVNDDFVGPNAAIFVNMSTRIRSSTQKERDSVAIESESGDRGLTVRENISEDLLSIVMHMKKHVQSVFTVSQLRTLLKKGGEEDGHNVNSICDFTLCSFVKCCVDLGVMSVIK